MFSKDGILELPSGELVVNITRGCNLRCSHCYQFDIDSKASILNDTGYIHMNPDDAIKYIEKHDDELIRFYGGEPLVNYKTIMRVMDHFGDSRKYAITTNALLHDRLPDEYWSRFWVVKVSHEGYGRVDGVDHEKSDAAIHSIIEKVEHPLRVMVSMTISSDTMNSGVPLLTAILGLIQEFGIRIFEVGLDVFADYGSNRINEVVLGHYAGEMLEALIFSVMNQGSFLLLSRDVVMANIGEDTQCSYLNGEYTTIDIDGSEYRCHVAHSMGIDLSEITKENTSILCPLAQIVNPGLAKHQDRFVELFTELKEAIDVNEQLFVRNASSR